LQLPEVQVGIKNTTVKIPDFEIPRLMEDKDIKISPKINLTGLMPESWMHSKDGKNATLETTVINLPKGSLPLLPVPKDAVNVGFKVCVQESFTYKSHHFFYSCKRDDDDDNNQHHLPTYLPAPLSGAHQDGSAQEPEPPG
jgi:hypothetical protein